MKNVLVFRNNDSITICQSDLTPQEYFTLCYCSHEGNLHRLVTINTDATYIGTKNIREYGDQEIVDALLWNRGFKVMTNPEVC